MSLDPLLIESDMPKHHPGSVLANVGYQWRLTRAAVWLDLRAVRWRWSALKLGISVWIAGLLGVWVFLVMGGSISGILSLSSPPCTPDDSFVFDGNYKYWSPSGFFQIDLNLAGNFSFAQAKIIDISFDIILGRMGQAALAFFSWKAFSQYLTASAQVSPISYKTYWTIFLDREPSILSTIGIIREFTTRTRLQSRSAMVFMVLSMTFILAVPTIGGAMTGYSPRTSPFVAIESNNTVPLSSFLPVLYVIHDGNRINLSVDYSVPWWDTWETTSGEELNPVQLWEHGYQVFKCYNTHSSRAKYNTTSPCKMQYAISDYVVTYGLNGYFQNDSTFNGKPVSKPLLNISAYYMPDRYLGTDYIRSDEAVLPPFNKIWVDPIMKMYPFNDTSRKAYMYSNVTYFPDYIPTHGQCQIVINEGDIVYKWGFSFMQLFLAITLLLLWSWGTFVMWYKAKRTLATRSPVHDVPQKYQAVVLLAKTIQDDLKHIQDDHGETSIDDSTSGELQWAIETHLGGGIISLRPTALPETYGMWRGTLRWIKNVGSRMRTYWCWYTMATLIACFIGGGWTVGLPSFYRHNAGAVFTMWLWMTTTIGFLPMVFGLRISSTTRSRVALTILSLVLGCVGALAVVLDDQQRYQQWRSEDVYR